MRNRNRLITALLAAMMLMAPISVFGPAALAAESVSHTASGSLSFADQNGLHSSPFVDIGDHWARQYIEQLTVAGVIRGVGEDRFAPDDQVETVQVLTMLVRALGLDDLAREYAGQPRENPWPNSVPAWARGYVQAALTKEIFTEAELLSLKAGQIASRLDVARFVARLFDDSAVPPASNLQGLSDVQGLSEDDQKLVAMLLAKGIMVGSPDGLWMPAEPVSRSQMAKVMALSARRLAVNSGHKIQVIGQIAGLDTDSQGAVVVSLAGDDKQYLLASDCPLYIDRKQMPADRLSVGQRGRFVLTAGSAPQPVGYVEILAGADDQADINGTIAALGYGLEPALTVRRDDGDEVVLAISEDAVISLSGREVFLSDLVVGQQITARIAPDSDTWRALWITAEPDEQQISGVISAVVMRSHPSLSVQASAGQYHTVSITGRSQIRLNGQPAALQDLRPGDTATWQATGGEALWIDARRQTAGMEMVEGKITALVLGNDPSLSIRTDEGEIITYLVADEGIRVYVNDSRATLDALQIGWTIRLDVAEERVLNIRASYP